MSAHALRSSRKVSLALSAVLGVLVAGCNTTDPNQGGFLGGVGGLVSGNYAQQTRAKQADLQNEKDKQIALQRKAERLKQQNAALSQELRATEAELQKIEEDLVVLDRRLVKAKVGEGKKRTELAALKSELDNLSQDIDRERLTFSESGNDQRLRELQRRKADLQKQIEQFLLTVD